MEDGEEEEGKGLVVWFCVRQDCPPSWQTVCWGGCLFGPSKTSALARVTATTTLAEARPDVGSTCSHDGDDDAGRGACGHRLSLARVTATTTLAEARADIGSRFLA
jgi:hypothetical protein